MWPVCRGARQAPALSPGPAAAPGSPITKMCPGWSWHGPHSGWPVPCGHCLVPWPRLMGASRLGHKRLGPGPRPLRTWGAPALTARCSSGARPRLCPAALGSQMSIRFASSLSSGPQLSQELPRGLTCSPVGLCRWEDQHTAASGCHGVGPHHLPSPTGATCEVVLAPCASSPCRNGGECRASEDYESFSCVCPAGWQGEATAPPAPARFHGAQEGGPRVRADPGGREGALLSGDEPGVLSHLQGGSISKNPPRPSFPPGVPKAHLGLRPRTWVDRRGQEWG